MCERDRSSRPPSRAAIRRRTEPRPLRQPLLGEPCRLAVSAQPPTLPVRMAHILPQSRTQEQGEVPPTARNLKVSVRAIVRACQCHRRNSDETMGAKHHQDAVGAMESSP